MHANFSILIEMSIKIIHSTVVFTVTFCMPWPIPNNSLLSVLVLLICLFSTATVCHANVFLELPIMTLGFLYCVVTAQSPISCL